MTCTIDKIVFKKNLSLILSFHFCPVTLKLPCREAVCPIFMVFGLTRPGREPITYRVRGGHANQ